MLGFFGGKEKAAGGAGGERTLRHSSGWGRLLQRLRAEGSLRVLDIGPTSPTNINLITSMGHSIYLANLVEDAARREWRIAGEDGQPAGFNVDGLLAAHLNFSGRGFDAVLFWDTADYLPQEVLVPVLARIHQVMAPGGIMLAMFHAKPAAGVSGTPSVKGFSRYHLTETDAVEAQRVGDYPLLHTYTNREIERLLSSFASFHFILGKDNLREVVVTR